MTLVELLEKVRSQLDTRGNYAVVAGPRSRSNDASEDSQFHSIVSAFADDDAHEFILRTSETEFGNAPESDRMTLRELFKLLDSQESASSGFDVQTSSSGPEDGFRVDFPILGTGWGDETRVFALLW